MHFMKIYKNCIRHKIQRNFSQSRLGLTKIGFCLRKLMRFKPEIWEILLKLTKHRRNRNQKLKLFQKVKTEFDNRDYSKIYNLKFSRIYSVIINGCGTCDDEYKKLESIGNNKDKLDKLGCKCDGSF